MTPAPLPPLPKAWILWLEQLVKPLETLEPTASLGQIQRRLGQHDILRKLREAQELRASPDETGWPRLDH